ncbi:hypothetical protein ENSA5_58760 [Enhygromyxa salina]|uniref:HTH HARE-type domain-containing protein n=1 Tax=Enhygromyxa salina TaxID=215803 RepID=A0A2S9XDX5_9BACT|nr:winged helix-turn-helix domain-containing protein [Enhygromyxa salina]PRP91066.1 hypothetical protein ENSA5_58760 [Enhygromyxa salina]
MTFLEAAIEILRSTEDPLHFNDIARLAVERKLLSHVGRDPEAAMRSCLNSAVRSKVHDGLVMRSKPGHYRLRPGVAVPDLPPPPSSAEPLPDAELEVAEAAASEKPAADKPKKVSKTKKKARTSSKRTSQKTKSEEAVAAQDAPAEATPAAPKKTTRRRSRSASKSEPAVTADDSQLKLEVAPEPDGAKPDGAKPGDGPASVPVPELDPSKVRFRGPEGSGLEGDTDIALVMANAMSRLVDERPELREELEAMQKVETPDPEVIEVGRKKRSGTGRAQGRGREERSDRARDDRGREDREEDRGSRRRRRRRRRNRRVEWSESGGQRSQAARGDELLDRVATVLSEAGSRSLHVRQIAESLAAQDVLGGEISEIERAVTAAMLLDVNRRGDASRFAVRGDARYQLRGSRLPEKAAAAEHAMRAAVQRLENETESQLHLWLQSLGARSLESLVRIWLAREGFTLVGTLPPSRGLGKLVVDDPDPEEDEARTLVLVVPRKTSLEPKLWDGEAERNGCANTMVFAMCDPPADQSIGETRVVFAPDLVRWLLRRGIGVRNLSIQVPVLDPDLIESVGGLDT